MSRACVVRQHYVPQDPRVVREVEALAALGYDVDIVCLRKNGERWHERCGSTVVWRLPVSHARHGAVRYVAEYGLFLALSALLVTALHCWRRYRLVQVNTLPDVLIFAAWFPRMLGTPLLLDLQECMPDFFSSKYELTQRHPVVRVLAFLEQLSIRFADAAITPTAQMRETFIRRGADPARLAVVMDGADERVFRVDPSAARPDGEQFTLVSHGTVEERYGIDTVIRAVALLRHEIPELRLEVYGDGSYLDRLRGLAVDLGVEQQVRFTGCFVPISELVNGIQRADVGVVAIKRDPFRDVALAGKMFDFIAMRKPIVVSRTRSVEQYFDESSCELFESDDPTDLARAIRVLHGDPERRRRLPERAARVAEPYQWAQQRLVYQDVVRRLVNQRAEDLA